jgi:hypothetical protein
MSAASENELDISIFFEILKEIHYARRVALLSLRNVRIDDILADRQDKLSDTTYANLIKRAATEGLLSITIDLIRQYQDMRDEITKIQNSGATEKVRMNRILDLLDGRGDELIRFMYDKLHTEQRAEILRLRTIRMEPASPNTCHLCSKTPARLCSCRTVCYCSTFCQLLDRRRHRADCNPVTAPPAAAAESPDFAENARRVSRVLASVRGSLEPSNQAMSPARAALNRLRELAEKLQKVTVEDAVEMHAAIDEIISYLTGKDEWELFFPHDNDDELNEILDRLRALRKEKSPNGQLLEEAKRHLNKFIRNSEPRMRGGRSLRKRKRRRSLSRRRLRY